MYKIKSSKELINSNIYTDKDGSTYFLDKLSPEGLAELGLEKVSNESPTQSLSLQEEKENLKNNI